MANFKQCRECVKAQGFHSCPFDKLHREVKNHFIHLGEYYCKAFEQKPAPPPRMTDEEYAKKQEELLEDIPKEFHSALSSMAYEDGHSSGYEECINILHGLVSDLKPAIEKYRENLVSRFRNGTF